MKLVVAEVVLEVSPADCVLGAALPRPEGTTWIPWARCFVRGSHLHMNPAAKPRRGGSGYLRRG